MQLFVGGNISLGIQRNKRNADIPCFDVVIITFEVVSRSFQKVIRKINISKYLYRAITTR